MGKNVLISTFNNSLNNYGAVFQSYALSKNVEKLGYKPIFLTLQRRNSSSFVQPKKTLKRRIKEKAAAFSTKPTKPMKIERAKKFKAFIAENQNQVRYKDLDELTANPPRADVYLSGSDQVWNPRSLHKELMLSFAPDEALLVSYAASMGAEKVPPENEEIFAKYISRYDAVSVREDTIADVIKGYTDKPINQHVDPVFLLDKNEWITLAKPYEKLKFEKYIMLYMIEFDGKLVKKFKKLRKETGLPLVLVTLSGRRRGFADLAVLDASPEEFLQILSGAEMVVASSFHGCALSVVFNKPFISISGKDKPTRIESMLRHFGLEKQNNAELSLENAKIDYDSVNEKIKEDRIISEKYLTEIFSMEK